MGIDRLSKQAESSARWGDRGRTLVIAHRGASADAPENTMRAFRLAKEQGADGIELDVMCARSGEVVVFHDDDLCRFDGGKPCSHRRRHTRVRESDYDTLKRCDLGSGERMPLLEEVLEETGPDLLVNIELKSAPTWLSRLRDEELPVRVAEIVRRQRAARRVLISSFDPLLLRRYAVLDPPVVRGLLFASDQSLALRRGWAAPFIRPLALHPEAKLCTAARMAEWRRSGYALHVWTVDDPGTLRFLKAHGVEGIITNRPAEAVKVLTGQGQ